MSLFDLFMSMDSEQYRRNNILKAPFSYPGSKQKALKHILPELPYKKAYVEPFAGSACVLIARDPSPIEVLNDRYAGVTDFYRCLQDDIMWQKLRSRLDIVCHSREEFIWCRATWKNIEDPIERAARWYYMILMSFSQKGLQFGRATQTPLPFGRKFENSVKLFSQIHERLKNVIIENQDYQLILKDFDANHTVFYMDPPYVDTGDDMYKWKFNESNHRLMLDIIFSLKGFVALSGYDNDLYNSFKWDHKIEYDSYVSIQAMAETEENNLMGRIKDRGNVTECLWIKESN